MNTWYCAFSFLKAKQALKQIVTISKHGNLCSPFEGFIRTSSQYWCQNWRTLLRTWWTRVLRSGGLWAHIIVSSYFHVVIVSRCLYFKTLQLHKFYLRNTNFIIILNICCQSCQYDWTNFEAQMGSMRVKVDFLTPFPNATQCLNVYTTPNYQFHIYSLNMLSLLLSNKSRNPWEHLSRCD